MRLAASVTGALWRSYVAQTDQSTRAIDAFILYFLAVRTTPASLPSMSPPIPSPLRNPPRSLRHEERCVRKWLMSPPSIPGRWPPCSSSTASSREVSPSTRFLEASSLAWAWPSPPVTPPPPLPTQQHSNQPCISQGVRTTVDLESLIVTEMSGKYQNIIL